jgi:hypothetical protein
MDISAGQLDTVGDIGDEKKSSILQNATSRNDVNSVAPDSVHYSMMMPTTKSLHWQTEVPACRSTAANIYNPSPNMQGGSYQSDRNRKAAASADDAPQPTD